MKRCTYCGKEYLDDVTVCPLDQNPVTSDGQEIVQSREPRPDIRLHLAARPLAVKFAVGLFAFAAILDLALMIFRYQLSGAKTRDFYLVIVFTYAFSGALLYFVFRGKNWARWVVTLCTIFGILVGPFMRIGPPNWEYYFFTLIDVVAVFALFQRLANEWYRGPKKISSPAPV